MKLWKDIKINDKLNDGSIVTYKHDVYTSLCYDLYYKKFVDKTGFLKEHVIRLSDTHMLLCNISHLNPIYKKWIAKYFDDYKIIEEYKRDIYFKDYANRETIKKENETGLTDPNTIKVIITAPSVSSYDNVKKGDNLYWLPVSTIYELVNDKKQKVYCNGYLFTKILYSGNYEVSCIETNTHQYKINGLIHHNSVALRNIIHHCLEHREDVSLALIDLKLTEFMALKPLRGIVGVANTVEEASELFQIAREIMYKRNNELANLGLTDVKDYVPTEATNIISVCGMHFDENDELDVEEIDEQGNSLGMKKIKASELLQQCQEIN